MDDEYEDFSSDRDDEPRCPFCNGSGRIPSSSDQASRGIQYVACDQCEAGTRFHDNVGEFS